MSAFPEHGLIVAQVEQQTRRRVEHIIRTPQPTITNEITRVARRKALAIIVKMALLIAEHAC
jgi:hypothetical protein